MRSSESNSSIIATSLLTLLFFGTSEGARAQESEHTTTQEQIYIQLILDASKSMWNSLEEGNERKPKLVAAREVMSNFIGGLPNDLPLNVGLRIFGSKAGRETLKRCQNTKLFVNMPGLDQSELIKTINNTTTAESSPIALSLVQAVRDFPDGGKRLIVLVTDGVEACEGDAEAAIESLRKKGIEIELRIIGIKLKPADEAWYRQRVPKTYNIYSTHEFTWALQQATKETLVSESAGHLAPSAHREMEPTREPEIITIDPGNLHVSRSVAAFHLGAGVGISIGFKIAITLVIIVLIKAGMLVSFRRRFSLITTAVCVILLMDFLLLTPRETWEEEAPEVRASIQATVELRHHSDRTGPRQIWLRITKKFPEDKAAFEGFTSARIEGSLPVKDFPTLILETQKINPHANPEALAIGIDSNQVFKDDDQFSIPLTLNRDSFRTWNKPRDKIFLTMLPPPGGFGVAGLGWGWPEIYSALKLHFDVLAILFFFLLSTLAIGYAFELTRFLFLVTLTLTLVLLLASATTLPMFGAFGAYILLLAALISVVFLIHLEIGPTPGRLFVGFPILICIVLMGTLVSAAFFGFDFGWSNGISSTACILVLTLSLTVCTVKIEPSQEETISRIELNIVILEIFPIANTRFHRLTHVRDFEDLRVDRFEHPEFDRREFEEALDCADQLWLILPTSAKTNPEFTTTVEDQLCIALEILRTKNRQPENVCGRRGGSQAVCNDQEEIGESPSTKVEPVPQLHAPSLVVTEDSPPAPKQVEVERRIESRCGPREQQEPRSKH